MARTPQDPTPPTVPDDIPQGDEDDDEDVDDEAQYPRSYAIGSNATLRADKKVRYLVYTYFGDNVPSSTDGNLPLFLFPH